MNQAHKGMDISSEEFDIFVGLLVDTLSETGIS